MEAVGSKAPARMGEADPEEADSGEATHLWVGSVYPSRVQLEEPERWSGL